MTQFTALLNIIFSTIAPIFLVIGVTILLARYRSLDVQTLSRISIYLFSPALILHSVADSGLGSEELGDIVLAAIVVCVAMAIVGSMVARVMGYNRRLASAFTLTAFVMNSVNFGFPFIEFAFGPEGLEPAIVFSVGQGLVAYLIGTYVATRGEGSVKTAVRNVITIPMPYAFAIGLWLNVSGNSLPMPIMRASEVLGQGIVPAALVILGLQLRSAKLKGRWGPILVATFTRYGIGALVAFGVAMLFGLQGLTRQVFILEASMPAGILSGVLSTEFGGDAEFAAATILVTTVSSTIFLSILLLLVTG